MKPGVVVVQLSGLICGWVLMTSILHDWNLLTIAGWFVSWAILRGRVLYLEKDKVDKGA